MLFSSVKAMFVKPEVLEKEDSGVIATGIMVENIKYITNTYMASNSEQKEVLIDTIIKVFLGVITGIQEHQIPRTKNILSIINTIGDGFYQMIVNGDKELAKNYIASSLNDMQKQILQNLIKVIAQKQQAQPQQATSANAFGMPSNAMTAMLQQQQQPIRVIIKKTSAEPPKITGIR